MENMVSREAYNVDETGYWRRMPIFTGISAAVLFGLMFGFVFLFIMNALVEPIRLPFNLSNALALSVLSGIPFGITFGITFPLVARQIYSSAVDKIYNGDLKTIGEIPTQDIYTHRLPCSWLKSNTFSIGGVLYIGEESLVFVPNTQNLPQHRKPFDILPLGSLEMSVTEMKLGWLKKMIMKRPPRLLEISWSTDNARFVVPDAEQTLMRIKQVVDRRLLEREKFQNNPDNFNLTPLEKILND